MSTYSSTELKDQVDNLEKGNVDKNVAFDDIPPEDPYPESQSMTAAQNTGRRRSVFPRFQDYINIPNIPEGTRTGGFSSTRKDESGNLVKWSYTDLVLNWAENTTFHGIKFFCEKSDIFARKVIWLLVVLVFIALLCRQVSQRVFYFMSNPASIKMEVDQMDTLSFPTITICNTNEFKISNLATNNHYEALYTRKITPEIANTSMDFLMREGFTKEDMIVECTWMNENCSSSQLTDVITDDGSCFAFNLKSELNISETGPQNGLSLVLNVQQYEYIPAKYGAAGIKFLVHNHHDFPIISSYGITAQSGTHTYVGISVGETINLPRPYGKCENKELEHFDYYTESNCILNCRTKYYVSRCGCRESYMQRPTNVSVCTFYRHMTCITEAIEEFHKIQNKFCSCTPSCQFLNYATTLSYLSMAELQLQDTIENSMKDKIIESLIVAGDAATVVFPSHLDADKALFGYFINEVTTLKILLEINFTTFNNGFKVAIIDKIDNMIGVVGNWQSMTMTQCQTVDSQFVRKYKTAKERTLLLVAHRFFELTLELTLNIEKMISDTTTPADRNQINYFSNVYIEVQQKCVKSAVLKVEELLQAYEIGEILKSSTSNDDTLHSDIPKNLLRDSIEANHPTWVETHNILGNMSKTLGYMATELETANKTKTYNNNKWKQLIEEYQTLCKKWTSKNFHFIDKQFTKATVLCHQRINNASSMLKVLETAKMTFGADLLVINDHAKNLSTVHMKNLVHVMSMTKRYLEDNPVSFRYDSKTLKISKLLKDIDANKRKLNLVEYALAEFNSKLTFYMNQWIGLASNLAKDIHTMRTTIVTDKDNQEYNLLSNLGAWFPDELVKEDESIVLAVKRELKTLETFSGSVASVNKFISMIMEKVAIYESELKIDSSFFTTNFLKINIYLKDMTVRKVIQEKVYGVEALLSDVGGTVGLFIGGSLLSMVEVLDLLAQLMHHNTNVRKSKNPEEVAKAKEKPELENNNEFDDVLCDQQDNSSNLNNQNNLNSSIPLMDTDTNNMDDIDDTKPDDNKIVR